MGYEFGDFSNQVVVDPHAVLGTLKSLQHHNSKSINSFVLSLVQGTPVTSIHDYLKNNGFDYADFCQ